jgi:colicin import membrane protein
VPIVADKDTPLDLNEAHNAIRNARWAHADKDASESFEKAEKLLKEAEAYKARKAGAKPVSMTARGSGSDCGDARLIALKRQAEDRLADEREGGSQSRGRSKSTSGAGETAVGTGSQLRTQAELEQKLEAERRARAEAERAAAEAQAAAALAQAEASRERALKDQAAASRLVRSAPQLRQWQKPNVYAHHRNRPQRKRRAKRQHAPSVRRRSSRPISSNS